MDGRALLFVGPDGSGRFTLAEAMGITFQIPRVVSYTTRPKQAHETNGKEYYFIDPSKFVDIELAGEFIECVESDGYRYGIKKADCENLLQEAGSFFAILSPAGCEIFRNIFDRTLSIFVFADRETVIERQQQRGDDEYTIQRHLSHYDQIMAYQNKCDIVIPNYDLPSTAQELTKRIEHFLNMTYHPDSKY